MDHTDTDRSLIPEPFPIALVVVVVICVSVNENDDDTYYDTELGSDGRGGGDFLRNAGGAGAGDFADLDGSAVGAGTMRRDHVVVGDDDDDDDAGGSAPSSYYTSLPGKDIIGSCDLLDLPIGVARSKCDEYGRECKAYVEAGSIGYLKRCADETSIQDSPRGRQVVLHVKRFAAGVDPSLPTGVVGAARESRKTPSPPPSRPTSSSSRPPPQPLSPPVIPFVIMAHDRVEYMRQTMESIARSDVPRNNPIVVSLDGHVPEMMEYIDSVRDRFDITLVHHPNACHDNPNQFPARDDSLNENFAGDQYGNPRSEWATCAKHHWWWMMHRVWAMGYDVIFQTEEDYEVAPTIFETLRTGLGLCQWPDCFGVLAEANRGKGNDKGAEEWTFECFQTGPVAIRRQAWNALRSAREDFCTFDEYGWDWSVVHTMAIGKVPHKVVAPTKRQVRHIGMKGMHGREVVARPVGPFHGTTVRKGAKVPAVRKHKGNGGWAHPKDHEHCLQMTAEVEQDDEEEVTLVEKSEKKKSGPVSSSYPFTSFTPMCPRLRQWREMEHSETKTGFFSSSSVCWTNSIAHGGPAALCMFEPMGIDRSKIKISRGGERPEDVRGRKESEEFPTYEPGAISLPSRPKKIQTRWYQKKLLEASVERNCAGEPAAVNFKGTTLLFERVEYANLWHTMNDWFNTHWALDKIFEGRPNSRIRIVFLDGHAKSIIDDVWAKAFDAEVLYLSQVPANSCFERAVWIPKSTPLWDTDATSPCNLDSFVDRVLQAYGIERPKVLSEIPVVIDRKPYFAHPRSKMKIDRTISNLAETYPSANVVDLVGMSFKEQLQLIVSTKTLMGLHGAALTHLIWMSPGSQAIEWIASSHRNVLLFEHIATWRPNVTYRRLDVPKDDAALWDQVRSGGGGAR
eukprot:g5000.t1